MDYKQQFIRFLAECGVLKFGTFKLKSGRIAPYFLNAGEYKTGAQIKRLGEFYAACIHDVYQAQRAELSNHANIVTMGSQVIGIELAKCLLKEYLSCTYDPNCRSKDKVQRIIDFENEE